MNLLKRYCFLRIFAIISLNKSQNTMNTGNSNNYINDNNSNKKLRKSLIEKQVCEKKFSRSSLPDFYSDMDSEENNDTQISIFQQTSESNHLTLDEDLSTYVSESNDSSIITNDIKRNVKYFTDNKNFNTNIECRKRKGIKKQFRSKKSGVLEPFVRWKHTNLIRKRIEKKVSKNLGLEYYRYLDFTNSSFILIFLDKLLTSCFNSFDSKRMEKLRFLIVDIFLYYRFKAVKNSLITKKRINNFLKEIGRCFDSNTSFEISKYILRTKKKLKNHSINYFMLYPNLASHRGYADKIYNYLKKKDSNMLRNKMIESLPNLRDSIILKLNEIISEYLGHSEQELNEEDMNIIRDVLNHPIVSKTFESIIDTDSRRINLEEEDPFEKFYQNLFMDQLGNPFPFIGSAKAIKIQKLIIFVKACIYEQKNQLTHLEYIALLNFMSKKYKKYTISRKRNSIEEVFYDSLCFFVQSFAYCENVDKGSIKYSFNKDPSAYQKGLRLLKRLFPKWGELISELKINFSAMMKDNTL